MTIVMGKGTWYSRGCRKNGKWREHKHIKRVKKYLINKHKKEFELFGYDPEFKTNLIN